MTLKGTSNELGIRILACSNKARSTCMRCFKSCRKLQFLGSSADSGECKMGITLFIAVMVDHFANGTLVGCQSINCHVLIFCIMEIENLSPVHLPACPSLLQREKKPEIFFLWSRAFLTGMLIWDIITCLITWCRGRTRGQVRRGLGRWRVPGHRGRVSGQRERVPDGLPGLPDGRAGPRGRLPDWS